MTKTKGIPNVDQQITSYRTGLEVLARTTKSQLARYALNPSQVGFPTLTRQVEAILERAKGKEAELSDILLKAIDSAQTENVEVLRKIIAREKQAGEQPEKIIIYFEPTQTREDQVSVGIRLPQRQETDNNRTQFELLYSAVSTAFDSVSSEFDLTATQSEVKGAQRQYSISFGQNVDLRAVNYIRNQLAVRILSNIRNTAVNDHVNFEIRISEYDRAKRMNIADSQKPVPMQARRLQSIEELYFEGTQGDITEQELVQTVSKLAREYDITVNIDSIKTQFPRAKTLRARISTNGDGEQTYFRHSAIELANSIIISQNAKGFADPLVPYMQQKYGLKMD